MGEKKFFWKEAVGFGWKTMKANIGFFIGFLLVVWIAQYLPNFLAEKFKGSPLASLFFLGSIFIGYVIGLGLVKTALRFCDNQPGQWDDLFAYVHLFFRYLGASLLCMLAVIGGFILLIVPGIIMAIRLQFYVYLIVDRNLSVMEFLKTSFAMTKGATWDLFVFGVVVLLINLAGALCLLVGLFATVPTTLVATAFVYRKFLASTESSPAIKGA